MMFNMTSTQHENNNINNGTRFAVREALSGLVHDNFPWKKSVTWASQLEEVNEFETDTISFEKMYIIKYNKQEALDRKRLLHLLGKARRVPINTV